ncbi:hypothetical protein DdX_00419 [Ditylenchus destructor]|uniref:Uncharacterized protein n=1 Tax=Ditylenchus destructor TaxID=166010 RepID=A0AAD4RAC3_9BILA|nr:hypothetical protein DdX_00419 [Ditylenchus destructor]
MPIPSSTFICDILRFLSRNELCEMYTISALFKKLLASEFLSAPYVILSELLFINGNWELVPKFGRGYAFILDEDKLIDSITASKYLRFRTTRLGFGKRFPSSTTLEAISHVWNGNELRIPYVNFCKLLEIGRLFFSARLLYLHGEGSLSILDSFHSGKSEILHIIDQCLTPLIGETQVETIVAFLFKSVKSLRQLVIHTRNPLSTKQSLDIIEETKKKFNRSTVPVNFTFSWNQDNNQELPHTYFALHNERTNQVLNFGINGSGKRFMLYTSSS